jgi:hypothetical protein
MTAEIPVKFWGQFCENLNSLNDTVVDIRHEVAGQLHLVAQGTSIQSAAFDDTSEACNNILTFDLGSGLQHRVVEPTRLILRKDKRDEHYHLLEIPAESGTTLLVFHPGINLAMLGKFVIR